MISEKNFARSYSSIWIEYFPWLASYCQNINKYNLARVRSPIPLIDLVEHRAINNTIAFFHFKNLKTNLNHQLESTRDEVLEYMRKFPRNNISTYKFTENDRRIINDQTFNLRIRYINNTVINPFFPGCGILDSCYGDIIEDNKLIEIKAGDRNIIPADLKQLIIYTFLNWICDPMPFEIKYLEIYNPRLGYSWSNSIDDLFLSITNTPKEDVFDQIAKYLVTQSDDIEIT